MGKVIIEAPQLYKTFGAFAAVDGVSFTARQGECFGLLPTPLTLEEIITG